MNNNLLEALFEDEEESAPAEKVIKVNTEIKLPDYKKEIEDVKCVYESQMYNLRQDIAALKAEQSEFNKLASGLIPIMEKTFNEYCNQYGSNAERGYSDNEITYFPVNLSNFLKVARSNRQNDKIGEKALQLYLSPDGIKFFITKEWEEYFSRKKMKYSDYKKKWNEPRWFGEDPYPEEEQPQSIANMIAEKMLDLFCELDLNKVKSNKEEK